MSVFKSVFWMRVVFVAGAGAVILTAWNLNSVLTILDAREANARAAVAVGSSKSSYPLPMTVNVPASDVYKQTSDSVVVLSGISTCDELYIYDVNLVIAHDEWGVLYRRANQAQVNPMVRPAVFEGLVGQNEALKCSIDPGRVRFSFSEQEMGDHILIWERRSQAKSDREAVKSLIFSEPAGKDTRGKVKLFQ